MDLRKFIEVNISEGYINSILGGAESSMFHPMNIDVSNLIKRLLDLSDADKQQIYSQLQSGGISETQLTTGIIKKKLSFCTDFSVIINNILTLLGYDFAKHLIALLTLNIRLECLVANIREAKSYEQCKEYIQYVRNILSLNMLTISDGFDLSKYANPDTTYLSEKVPTSKTSFIDEVLREVDRLIVLKNKALINKDRTLWANILADLIAHTTVNDYVVKTVDDLCIYLGNFDVGYAGSFLRQFGMLYRENYADIPPEILSDEYIANNHPHLDFLASIDFDNYQTYLIGFNKYYKNVYKICVNDVCEVELKDKTYMSIKIQDELYDQLSHITLNLFIKIAKNIASAQSIQSYFGKSNRVQFIQIISALIGCQPRAEEFSESQREAIHYFLLTSRLLNDSYTMLINHRG